MNRELILPEWNSLASIPDAELHLFEIALLIAKDEYPALDANRYNALVDTYVAEIATAINDQPDIPAKLIAINQYLYQKLGFSGNDVQYDDPRNSYLNQVFDRKLGIPISLAVMQIEVMRRLGLPLEGVSFPGHYLVRLPVDDGILVLDPFNQGRPVSIEELRQRMTPHLDGQALSDHQLIQILEPATARMTLMRMLRNLKTIYHEKNDFERVARSADRLLKLAPDLAEALRDRGMAYMQIGHFKGAQADFSRYLHIQPEANDRDEIRALLIESTQYRPKLH